MAKTRGASAAALAAKEDLLLKIFDFVAVTNVSVFITQMVI